MLVALAKDFDECRDKGTEQRAGKRAKPKSRERQVDAARCALLFDYHAERGHHLLHTVGKVAVAHSQLIEIAEHGQIDAVSAFHILPPRCKKVVKISLESYYIFCT